MRTKVLNYFHTFHPAAQAELDRLAAQEKQIATMQARRAEGDPEALPHRRRASESPEDLEADLAAVREQMDAQRKVIASGVVRIVIKGLTRGEYRRLLLDHPPREDDPYDAEVGYNVDTFGDPLIRACIVKTLSHELLGGEPVPNEWDKWADEMTNGQWQDVFRACMRLTNDGNPSTFPR